MAARDSGHACGRRTSPALMAITRRTYSSSACAFQVRKLGACAFSAESAPGPRGVPRSFLSRALTPPVVYAASGHRHPHLRRQMLRQNQIPLPRGKTGSLQGVDQLAHVAGPGIFKEHVQHLLGQSLFRQLIAQAESGHRLPGQGRNLVPPLAQGRVTVVMPCRR